MGKWGFVAHKLRRVRKENSLTRKELAELSGVGLATIIAIEDETTIYKINVETARLLEDALYMPRKIFHPAELSHLGRPPKTGKPAAGKHSASARRYETKCPHCFLLVPSLPRCGWCTGILDEARVFDSIVRNSLAE